jgi:hypothetical protein
MSSRALAGKRGEFIASERLLDFCGNPHPYFDPHPLGEKFPTYDLLVELTGQHASRPYFLAQVRTTRSGGKLGMADLKVQLKAQDVRFMIRCPIPTYLIGIDERAEVAYIVSVHGNLKGGISSIATTFPLDRGNLKLLRDEVLAYWTTLAKLLYDGEQRGLVHVGCRAGRLSEQRLRDRPTWRGCLPPAQHQGDRRDSRGRRPLVRCVFRQIDPWRTDEEGRRLFRQIAAQRTRCAQS